MIDQYIINMFESGAPIPWEVNFRAGFGALETLHTAEERGYLQGLRQSR